MSETATQPNAQRTESPDLFRSDDEAPRYLKLPSQRAFNEHRRRVEKENNVRIRGVRSGRVWLYHRVQLDLMARLMTNVGVDDEA